MVTSIPSDNRARRFALSCGTTISFGIDADAQHLLNSPISGGPVAEPQPASH
jgi:hypothetical protein